MPVSKKHRNKPYKPKGVADLTFQARVTAQLKQSMLLLETVSLMKLKFGKLDKEEIIALHNLFNACQFMFARRRALDEYKGWPLNDYYEQIQKANKAVLDAYVAKESGVTTAYVFRGCDIDLVLDSVQACCDFLKIEVEKAPMLLTYDYFGGMLIRLGYDKTITKCNQYERYLSQDVINKVFEKAKQVCLMPTKQRQAFMRKWGIVEINQ